MKKIKVCICVNTLTSVNSFVYSNHIHFFTRAVRKFGDDIDFIFFTPPRMAIDTARNEAAKIALNNGCDYLFFLDDDVLVPADTLELLIEADKDVIAGHVVIRGFPFHVMAFKELANGNLTYYDDLPLKEGTVVDLVKEYPEMANEKIDYSKVKLNQLEPLVECGAVGFSCCLIKTSIFNMIKPPYFVTGVNSTEDVYFCIKAKRSAEEANLPKPSIFMHTQIECGHLLTAEPIGWGNRKSELYDYYDNVNKNEEMKMPNRSADYLSKVTRRMRGADVKA